MLTILIMDPDSGIRLLYASELSEEGYEVVTCGDASGLMQLIGRKKPDLVVMEVLLGDFDGLDILQDISHAYRELPVILCTALPHFKHDQRSAAAHGYVVKSSRVKELKDAIEEVLARGRYPRSTQCPAQGDLYDPMAQTKSAWKEIR
jgi:DNA-binding response OmpR family regulator